MTKHKTIISQMTKKRGTDGNNVSRVRLSSDTKVADEYERKTGMRGNKPETKNHNNSRKAGIVEPSKI